MEIRITLGKIEELVKDKAITHLGQATFKRHSPFSSQLVVTLPNERKKIEMPENAPFYNPLNGIKDYENKINASAKFISFVTKVLQKEEYYLAEAHFKPYRFHFDLPFSEILKGELYQKTQSNL